MWLGGDKKGPTAWRAVGPSYVSFLSWPGRSGSDIVYQEPLSAPSRRAAFCLQAFLYEKQLCESESWVGFISPLDSLDALDEAGISA